MPNDPVEEMAEQLLNEQVFNQEASYQLLQVYATCQDSVHKRPLFEKVNPSILATTVGVDRHGGQVGVSNETWARPKLTHYPNEFLRKQGCRFERCQQRQRLPQRGQYTARV